MHGFEENFPEDKGTEGGRCNRSVCLRPGAEWFNHSTKRWYCGDCARLINEVNPEFLRDTGYSICTLG